MARKLERLDDGYLTLVRELPCYFCGSRLVCAHHFPPRGRLGYTDDTRTIPVCARCHRRCHGERVDGADPISEQSQAEAVNATFKTLVKRAKGF